MRLLPRTVLALPLILVLTACASVADVDISTKDPSCQKCSSDYAECNRGFSFFPIMRQHACAEALRLCAQSCPARQP